MSHQHAPTRGRDTRTLAAVLVLILLYMVVEVVGGVLTGSLALLADGGHMLADASALGLALFAAWLAGRPATPERSFGYRRAEILAALVNGIALVVIAVWISVAAIRRLGDTPEILGGWMLAIAVVGLFVNLVALALLARSGSESLNLRAAFRHVLADLIGSLGVILAALVILITGWEQADPLAGLAIAGLIFASSWTIVRDAVAILLESAPAGVDAQEVGLRMAAAAGVVEVHDLHIWTITSGFPTLSAHVLVGRTEDCHARRRELEQMLAHDFGLEHTTLQVEHVGESRRVQIGPLRPPGASAS